MQRGRHLLKSVLKPISKLPWFLYRGPLSGDNASVVQKNNIVDKIQGILLLQIFASVAPTLVYMDGVWIVAGKSLPELTSSLDEDDRFNDWVFSSSCVTAE